MPPGRSKSMGLHIRQWWVSIRAGWLERARWQKTLALAALAILVIASTWLHTALSRQHHSSALTIRKQTDAFPFDAKPTSSRDQKETSSDRGSSFGWLESQTGEHNRMLRELEERLAATIVRLAHIRDARVHISVPVQPPFQKVEEQPKAAVVVWPQEGHQLFSADMTAVADVVSSAVDKLASGAIIVIDASSNMSFQVSKTGTNFLPADPSSQLSLRQKEYEDKVRALLGPWKDSAVVSVACHFASGSGEGLADPPQETQSSSAQETHIVPKSAAIALPRYRLSSLGETPTDKQESLEQWRWRLQEHIARALGLSARDVSLLLYDTEPATAASDTSGNPLATAMVALLVMGALVTGATFIKRRRNANVASASALTESAKSSALEAASTPEQTSVSPSRAESTIIETEDFAHLQPVELFSTVRNEHPQTIAYLLNRLPRQRAWQVLACFDSFRQKDILGRMSMGAGSGAPQEAHASAMVTEGQR